MQDGYTYEHCYRPVIHRNTPLPVTRTEEYYTASPNQTAVEVEIYQGDSPDALQNVHVGHFRIEGLTPTSDPNPVLCRMRLDLDGILHVTAIEKKTGLSKHVAISGATRRRDATEIARGREAIEKLFAERVTEDAPAVVESTPIISEPSPIPPTTAEAASAVVAEPAKSDKQVADAKALIERCRGHIPTMHPDDQEEAVNLIDEVSQAIAAGDPSRLAETTKSLSEFLFFVEGK
jgi:molecular chaperone DnaK (HSP70)